MYYVFDLLRLGEKDLRSTPSPCERSSCRNSSGRTTPSVMLTIYRQQGLTMFAGALALGLEGIVAKDSQEPVRGRTNLDLALAEDQGE